MIRNIRNGGGGGSSSTTTNDDDDSGGSFSVTSDPFSGGSGGKTGSEIIAEGGAPESAVTNDPSHESVSDKYDDPKSAFDDLVDRAHDADDGPTATFDATPNTQEGENAIRDSVESIIGATSGGDDQQTPENRPDMNLPQNVPVPLPDFTLPLPNRGNGDGIGKALLVAVAVALAVVFGG